MKKANGFTLIELMITLTVLGILVSIAVPSFFELLSNNRMTATTNSISAGLQAARSEAIIRKAPVIFCQNNGAGTGCAASLGTLAAGWIIGLDTDLNGSIDAGGVIRVTDAFPTSMAFTMTGFGSNFVRYNTQGMAASPPTSIQICDSSRTGELGNTILFNGTGGVTVSPTKPTCP